ncbi:MAG: exonuclease SbcCD subunit D [Candidatus Thermoplasmatota archaeon]|nr:exonuclease SbcCD subunit D [Candidatus Thermoplasmatota archaeon]
MRILHCADTHLGYSAYRKITEDGVNQREIDIYDAFIQCIDYAVKTKPDLVLHAGDLFDSVRPTNRAITVAVQQILRLSQEGIPFIVISGNHETPKLRETGNIFTIFEHLANVYPVHNNRHETISLKIKGETVLTHAIPQCQSPKEFESNFKKIAVNKNVDFNMLLAHGAVAGIKEFKMNEFNELFIPVKKLKEDFDYIALGHYHLYTKLQQNAFYSGSTEHLSFTEAEAQKGFLEIDLGQKVKHRFIPVKIRSMIDVPSVDCSSLRIDQISQRIKEIISSIDPKDKIIRIHLENIPTTIQRGIDYHLFKDLAKTAVHFEIRSSTLKTDSSSLQENYKMKSLADEFEKFLSLQQIQEKKELLHLGLHYIQKHDEQEIQP